MTNTTPEHQPAAFESETTTTLSRVVIEAGGTSTLTVEGKIRTLADRGGSTAWAEVTMTDSDFELEAVVLPDARQARMLAAYFLNLADMLDAATTEHG